MKKLLVVLMALGLIMGATTVMADEVSEPASAECKAFQSNPQWGWLFDVLYDSLGDCVSGCNPSDFVGMCKIGKAFAHEFGADEYYSQGQCMQFFNDIFCSSPD